MPRGSVRELRGAVDVLAQQVEVEHRVQPPSRRQVESRGVRTVHLEHLVRPVVQRPELLDQADLVVPEILVREPNLVPDFDLALAPALLGVRALLGLRLRDVLARRQCCLPARLAALLCSWVSARLIDSCVAQLRVESRRQFLPLEHHRGRLSGRRDDRTVDRVLQLRQERLPVVLRVAHESAQRLDQHLHGLLRLTIGLRVKGRAALEPNQQLPADVVPEVRCEARVAVADDRLGVSQRREDARLQQRENILRGRRDFQSNVERPARQLVDDDQHGIVALRRPRERPDEVHADHLTRARRSGDRQRQTLSAALVDLVDLTLLAAARVRRRVLLHLRPPDSDLEPGHHARGRSVAALDRVVRPAEQPASELRVVGNDEHAVGLARRHAVQQAGRLGESLGLQLRVGQRQQRGVLRVLKRRAANANRNRAHPADGRHQRGVRLLLRPARRRARQSVRDCVRLARHVLDREVVFAHERGPAHLARRRHRRRLDVLQRLVIGQHGESSSSQVVAPRLQRVENRQQLLLVHRIALLSGRHLLGHEGDRLQRAVVLLHQRGAGGVA